ncbi:MAG: 2-oxoacid ferredoxin oxidoreductase [Gammaproteobacteria bacterium RIFCSPHIGHO2_02_FULL_42_13]|nr:MAG: 2-oxoacid ferredoxin oxidoreductase [Gammaproteobacteria bacterium RIFCSPHIGHO2_02_FULL_42_13]OGT69416.1 MAG: 2-oxoacid ferredoxin oxidoreductase [Gammaproteobacteria bacterium RIFCSPLOWO2_02_FULL_42_9]
MKNNIALTRYDKNKPDIAWCPGCGNFQILRAMKLALEELNISPQQAVVVSGIGQAAKTPQYFNVNMFNGLHGRALPVATGIKLANPELVVIAEGGDGDMYGEGGNHFLHAIRRNPNLTHIVHNNMVYGLTKGQASPTSQIGFKSPIQSVTDMPLNPIAIAIAQNASFVARSFSLNINQLKNLLKTAIQHEGYALIDVFQPCVVFNKVNTYQWFQEHTYDLPNDYNPYDREKAFQIAIDEHNLALGIIYKNHID